MNDVNENHIDNVSESESSSEEEMDQNDPKSPHSTSMFSSAFSQYWRRFHEPGFRGKMTALLSNRMSELSAGDGDDWNESWTVSRNALEYLNGLVSDMNGQQPQATVSWTTKMSGRDFVEQFEADAGRDGYEDAQVSGVAAGAVVSETGSPRSKRPKP